MTLPISNLFNLPFTKILPITQNFGYDSEPEFKHFHDDIFNRGLLLIKL